MMHLSCKPCTGISCGSVVMMGFELVIFQLVWQVVFE